MFSRRRFLLQALCAATLTATGRSQRPPLRRRIPAPNPHRIHRITDASQWPNPFLIVQRDGVSLLHHGQPGPAMPLSAVPAALEALPDTAWPLGLVVAASENGLRSSQDDPGSFRQNLLALTRLLQSQDIVVDLWP